MNDAVTDSVLEQSDEMNDKSPVPDGRSFDHPYQLAHQGIFFVVENNLVDGWLGKSGISATFVVTCTRHKVPLS